MATWRIEGRIFSGVFRPRTGLSLLELLVVMTILIALGGIVVATLPGVLQRTQVATAAANVPQIDASIRQNGVLHQGLIGNRFDALLVGGSSLDGEVAQYVGGREFFQALKISEADVEALRRVGIRELVPADDGAENATFESHLGSPVVLRGDSRVCGLTAEAAAQSVRAFWNLEPAEDSRYLVFGLGSQCSLVGAGRDALFSDAPVHFSGDQLSSPDRMYARYLVVVELSGKGGETEARYVGTCIPGPAGIETISQQLQKHYQASR